MLRCVGRLANAPLPYVTRQPYFINRQHHLARLIIWDIYERLKHISVKQVVTELRWKYWICDGRGFIRSLFHKCTFCTKYQEQTYSYPEAPPLTTLWAEDAYPFYATGIGNFGPLFIKNIFNGDIHELYKVWVTLYACAETLGIVLDIVPFIDWNSFIESLRRFITRRGCPSDIISDCGRNFVSSQYSCHLTSVFHGIQIYHWHIGMGFFLSVLERVPKSYYVKSWKHID